MTGRGSGARRERSYDALILDVMLPGLDGLEIARRLRAERLAVPILMLTARDALHDRLRGFDAGADDYLPKPFAFEELLARLRAIMRRTGAPRRRRPPGGGRSGAGRPRARGHARRAGRLSSRPRSMRCWST